MKDFDLGRFVCWRKGAFNYNRWRRIM